MQHRGVQLLESRHSLLLSRIVLSGKLRNMYIDRGEYYFAMQTRSEPYLTLSVPQFISFLNSDPLSTLADWAQRFGVSKPLVSQWRSGARAPSRTVLILAAIYQRSAVDSQTKNWPMDADLD